MKTKQRFPVLPAASLLVSLLMVAPASVIAHDRWDSELNPVPHKHQWEEGEYVPQEILVKFLPETIALPEGQTEASIGDLVIHPEIESFLLASGASTFEVIFKNHKPGSGLEDWYTVTFSDPIDVSEMVAAFAAAPRVLVSEPNLIYHLTTPTCTVAASWGAIKARQSRH